MRKKPKIQVEIEGPVEVVGYVRVSTLDQADSGLSLEAQKERIRAQCLANGWELLSIYEDAGVSAKTLDRPGLRAAIAALGPGRVLLALKMDRLTRSVGDLNDLVASIQDAGGEWATIQERFDTTTATGRLMLRLIVELSQWEREVIGERTASALQQKRKQKERLGTTPLGYVTRQTDQGAEVEIDPEGMETVQLARHLRGEGLSLHKIAARFTAEGRRTARGGRWHAQTVALLLDKRYLERIGH